MTMFKVKRPAGRRTETVYADYHRVENGVVTFRMSAKANAYPEFVKCYAAGAWLSVESAVINHERKLR